MKCSITRWSKSSPPKCVSPTDATPQRTRQCKVKGGIMNYRFCVSHVLMVCMSKRTRGGQHFEYSIVDGQDGHIECTTTQIVHKNILFRFLIQAIGNCRGGRLVDNPNDIQTSDSASILSSLALGVVEIRCMYI